MSDHVLENLGAYLDGELQGEPLRVVEQHLAECQACLEEYQSLQALSGALHAAPLPGFPSPERLAAQVALRLPRNQVQPVSRRMLEFSWWMVPVGLIVVWIFMSTTLLVSEMVTAAQGLGWLEGVSAWLAAGPSREIEYAAFLGQLGLLNQGSLPWFTLSESLARTFVSNVYWQVLISMLYLSWMAFWWARQTRKGLGQPFDGGSMPTVK
jgi:hypothetical protein